MKKSFLVLASLTLIGTLWAAKIPTNYDESKIPNYTLPNVLADSSGKEMGSSVQWLENAKPEIVKNIKQTMFGNPLPMPEQITFKVLEEGPALDGIAIRKQIQITLKDMGGEKSFIVLLHYPKNTEVKKSPIFIGLNFSGNHTLDSAKEIIGSPYRKDFTKLKIDEERGSKTNRWDLKYIVGKGYAVASCYYMDIYYDRQNHFKDSIYTIYGDKFKESNAPSIAAWAFGCSRILDAMGTISEIDTEKAIVIGHSRLGKTALLTGIFDPRFAMIISNNSGCMGAALNRRNYGETIKHITFNFPYWFSPELNKYGDNPDTLPIDMHQFIAALAPRPVYVASASEDKWADPKGELMSLVEASKVYKLFGANELPTMDNFKVEEPFIGYLGYHCRNGKHDLTLYDWTQYIKFADKHFFNK